MKTLILALTLAAPMLACAQAAKQAASHEVIYPANAGVFNVRDFGAKGDGVTDDTAAIQSAISKGLYSHRVIYLPDGTYLVSDTLKWNNGAQNNASGWGGFLQMQGQSREKTILKLKAGATGFGDKSNPKALIATGSGSGHGEKKYFVGEGNEAFENHLRDFSVETGDNAGAIGVDFQASNCGAMRRVSLKGNGFCGVSLMRRDNGPGMLKDVSISGFDYGVRAGQELCHFTFENIQLFNQRVAGMEVRDAIFGIRKLTTQGRAPALQISGIALVNLFDSNLQSVGNANPVAAIQSSGSGPRLFVRNLQTSGFKGSLQARGEMIIDANVSEWSSDAPVGPHATSARSLNLTVRDTPSWWDANSANWADAGAPSGNDDTAQIQAALNSGKSTIYFRWGTYRIKSPLSVPRTVKLLHGVGASLDAIEKFPGDAPMLRFEGGQKTDTTIMDRFTAGAKGGLLAEHADARTLVLQDLTLFDCLTYRNRQNSGPLFVEDVTASLRIEHPTQVWARQLNIEALGNPKVFNNGGTVWVLGWKSETGEILAENRNGGQMEMWAGLPYTFGVPRDNPAFVNENSSLLVSMAGMTFTGGDNPFYSLLVRDTQNNQSGDLRRDGLPGRGGAVFLPFFVSTPQAQTGAKPTFKTIAASGAASTSAPIAMQSFGLPRFMDGEKNGESAGNPAIVEGRAIWQLEQVWPDDILKREHFKPLVWGGQNWVASEQKFGAASAKIENGNLNLGVRAAWGGDGDVAGSKLAAATFIAPRKARYIVSGTARAGVWQGDGAVSLHVLKRDATKMTRLQTIALPKDTDVNLENLAVELDTGEELVLVPQIAAWYTGANVELKGLKVEIAQVKAPKIGDVVSVDGVKYRVERVEGGKLVLEAWYR